MDEIEPKHTTGLLIGKFMPPHSGHAYLIEFARRFADNLTVLVCSLKSEPIPGELRLSWMKETFTGVNFIHVTDENPQYPHEHPDFWKIWKDSIRKVFPGKIDFIFAGEDYGNELAEVLGAKFIPIRREVIQVSGERIRENPMAEWRRLVPAARPYFVRRVCIFGAESTGKSTLARMLAEHYDTVYAEEFARPLIDLNAGRCSPEDIPIIARGQAASEDALAKQANRVLFCDTDLITTTIWSDVLFGSCPEWIRQEADRRKYDLYLIPDIDVPWVDDLQRYLPNERESFLNRCIRELDSRNRPYVKISGTWDSRFEQACAAVDKLLSA